MLGTDKLWKLLHSVYDEVKVFCLIPAEASVICTGCYFWQWNSSHHARRHTHSLIRSNSCCCWCDRLLMTNVNLMIQTWWNHPSPYLQGLWVYSVTENNTLRKTNRSNNARRMHGMVNFHSTVKHVYTLICMKITSMSRVLFSRKCVQMHARVDVGSSVWTNQGNVSFHKSTDD